jgi:PHS family inorganic phosphate transporter-like MFS transporter
MAAIGAVVTLLTIRETKGLSLEVASEEPSQGIRNFKPNEKKKAENVRKTNRIS